MGAGLNASRFAEGFALLTAPMPRTATVLPAADAGAMSAGMTGITGETGVAGAT